MKNTYITSNDRRVYESNDDVITEVNKIEETNPSAVSEKENYPEKDRLLKMLKALFINGCNRSMKMVAKAMGVPVAQVKALLTEITLATETEKKVDYTMAADGGGNCKLYIQMGNRCEISLYGDNCTFNHYSIDREDLEKLGTQPKDKSKKLRGKKK